MRRLTKTEVEIVRYLVAGKNYVQIATAFGIKVQSVRWHGSNILRKLHCSNTREVIEWALKQPVRFDPSSVLHSPAPATGVSDSVQL